ncbi:condensation domain-containing protein, partial [Paenibacillus cisolokensis]|uniref:condensation domain-containing protein n=1 Tax=Paenibacillus cisolokensis TaxID=1658519 RepID=UPI003D288164
NAIPTLKLYILNGDQLCGIGMPGELCVAGAGVARGYLNRPELTAKKFVENPFEPGERMYRSGDLARWLPDGNIEYLGRMDDQVKIRGYRIELQEIEQVLLKQEAVQDAAVLARKDRAGDAYLCAYVVGKAEWTIEAGSLKESIRRDLPDYMVPAHIMVLEKLPVTNNGKLDRRSLPEPAQQERQAYVAPRNEQEQTLVQAFEQVLGVEPIGIDDNFFELGGDSIKAIRVISKLREAGYELGVKELMFERTPRNMAWKMEAVTAGLLKYSQEERTGEVQLTPIQKLFFGWKLARPHHYNQTMLLESKAPLNIDSLHAALKAVIKHHDMLRAIYPEEGRQYLLSSTESKGYDFSLFDLGSLEDEAQLAEVIETEGNRIQESIDLQAGPLLKVGLFRTIKGDQLLLCLHHLVVDGVSWRILLEDLETAYGQSERGEAIELPSKTASYQEWAEALQEYAGSEELARELSYWNEVRAIAEAQAMQHLKLTDAEPDYMTTTLKLDTDSTEQLLYEAGRMYNMEINDLLLSALSRSAREWKGQEGMMIELEGHGREIIHKPIDIDRTVGWFTSIFPVSLPYAEDLQQHLVAVKETLRKIPNRGMGYGVIQHLGRADWEPIRHEYCFNYLGQLDNESTEGRLLALSPFSAGESVARENAQAHPFTINASVLNKQLVLDITYDLNSYTPDQITHFKEIYRQAIADILAHCLAKDSTVQTASDFGELDLDMDEFNEIMRTYS